MYVLLCIIAKVTESTAYDCHVQLRFIIIPIIIAINVKQRQRNGTVDSKTLTISYIQVIIFNDQLLSFVRCVIIVCPCARSA